MLLHVAVALFSARDSATALQRIVAASRDVTGAGAAVILLYDRAQALFSPAVSRAALGLDEGWPRGQGLEAAQFLALRAAETRELVVILDTAETPELHLPMLSGQRRPGAACVAPLMVDGEIVGVLELFDAAPRRSGYHSDTLRAFARLAGVAMANASAYEREHVPRTRLEALDDASKALAVDLSLARVLQRIVDNAARLVRARYGALGVVGDDGYLSDFITTGISAEERARIGRLPRGHGLLGVLIRQGEPMRVSNIGRDPRRIGFPPHHPPMTSLLGVPIRARNEVVGDLYLTDKIDAPEFSADDQHMIEMLAAHAGVAIENARLYEQLREVTLLRERERIGRDLHDGIIQDIYAATLRLEILADDFPGDVRARLGDINNHLSGVIRDVRAYIHGLRPRELDGPLLSDSIAALVRETNERGDLSAVFNVDGEAHHLPAEVSGTLLRIVREAISNVIRHARAQHLEVRLKYGARGVTLVMSDDGRGFDVKARRGASHHGLRNMRARVDEAGGTFSVRSSPDSGTTVTATLPAHA